MNNSYLIRFTKLSLKNQLLLIEASIYTIWAWFMIRIFSFKRYLNWLKNPPEQQTPNEKEVLSVYRTLRKIHKYAFWPTTCYTEAISARLILKRKNIKSKIFLGMTKKDDGELLAHAWTKVGDKIITGGGNLESYKVLYIFED